MVVIPKGMPTAIILIPAYKPAGELTTLVDELILRGARRIVVVDDGSGPAYRPLFEGLATRPEVRVLRHAVNLGKGAALKTGINAILCDVPDAETIVTADADGQHSPADILHVAETAASTPKALILGARNFDGNVPWRSRLGNEITRAVFSILIGRRLSDTQTGLRAIPAPLWPHLLRLHSQGYDFELDMLIAAKHHDFGIVEIPIETIYLEENRGSHFNPLLDSMRIYFVLVRFASVSMATAILDNAIFGLIYWLSSQLAVSQIAGRLAALAFNYLTVKKTVFVSRQKHRDSFVKYLILVVVSGVMSYSLIRLITTNLPVSVMPAKIVVESLLFFFNFVVERDWVFRRPQKHDLY